jgi:NADH-quinone oxidoreductase subunit M
MALLAIPGSSNFIGEFYILNGTFQSKIVFALIASIGVALAAFYALRLYQRTMHNELPEGVESREISLTEGLVVAPLVAVIVALALWPGLILDRGEAAVTDAVAAVTGTPQEAAPEVAASANFDEPGWTGYGPEVADR